MLKKCLVALAVIAVSSALIFLAKPQWWEFLIAQVIIWTKFAFIAGKKLVWKFITTMTITKFAALFVKRYFMDNVLGKALNDHFLVHIKGPALRWWRVLDFKAMMFWFIPASIATGLIAFFAGIGNTAAFIFLKTLVIGFFKALWIIGAKVLFFITNILFNTWLAPIIEILALSWVIDKIEKIPFIKGKLTPFYNKVSKFFGNIGKFLDDKVHTPVNNKMNAAGEKTAAFLDREANKRELKKEIKKKMEE